MKKNDVLDLAIFFVTKIVGRRWTPADFRGRHMKEASELLKLGYDPQDIKDALLAIKAGDEAAFGGCRLPDRIDGMSILTCWGEPPLIVRFLMPPERPPVYSLDYKAWVRQYGRRGIETGTWDGIYIASDPRQEKDWLIEVIGDDRYHASVSRWDRIHNDPHEDTDGLQKNSRGGSCPSPGG